MSAKEEIIRQNQATSLTRGPAAPQTQDSVTASPRAFDALSDGADGPRLRVFLPPHPESPEKDFRVFPLLPDRWERLEIQLPADWRGQGLRLEPGGSFGLLEIAGARIISSTMGVPLWEMLGRDLIAKVRTTAGVQVVPGTHRLRLLCAGDDAQVWLPDVHLPDFDEPLVLELGLRVRTELIPIGYALQDWVRTADTHLHDALEELASIRGDRDRHIVMAREYLSAVEAARTDGSQREAALKEQLAAAHQDAKTHAAVLTVEIEAARTDGNQREAALTEQLATMQQAAQSHAATLAAEVETARAHGDERASALTGALEAARAHGDERVIALTGALEAARAHGDERVIALTGALEAARAHGDERAAVLTDALEGARAHSAQLQAAMDETNERLGEVREQLQHSQDHLHDAEVEIRELHQEKSRWRQDQEFLQQEIAGLHGELRAFDAALTIIRQQQALTHAELAEARRTGDADRGRVRSMRRSFSWRVTLPLRTIGRALTGQRPTGRQAGPGGQTA